MQFLQGFQFLQSIQSLTKVYRFGLLLAMT